MRTLAALLLGAALGAITSPASAQEAPAKAAAAAAAAAEPQDPPYDPAAHGGLSYGSYLRATRGRALRSPGMMVVGIVLVGVGNIVMGVGTGMYATAASSCANMSLPPEETGNFCSPNAGHTTGMAVLMAGTVIAAIGIPMWVLGGSPVPRVEAASAPTILPTIHVGPLGAALSWRF